jgi:hypothetical protein
MIAKFFTYNSLLKGDVAICLHQLIEGLVSDPRGPLANDLQTIPPTTWSSFCFPLDLREPGASCCASRRDFTGPLGNLQLRNSRSRWHNQALHRALVGTEAGRKL